MPITALPTPPSRQDPANFNDRADAFLGALPLFQTEANALQTNVNTSEVNAVNSAAAVLAATNIVKWVSGTTYASGAVVWSPINGLGYRRITASGSGTTDPSLDTTNYKQVNGTGDVSTTGNQTISGVKTFSSNIVGNVTGNVTGNITFNDNTVQTTKPMKLLNELIQTTTQTHTFSSLTPYRQLILVWDANQVSGPSLTTINLLESLSSVVLTTRDSASIITSSSSTNTAYQITQASNNTNILASFSSGACMTKGQVVLTKVRNISVANPQLWNAQIMVATTQNTFIGTTTLGSNSVSAGDLSIGSIYINFGQCDAINFRLYGME